MQINSNQTSPSFGHLSFDSKAIDLLKKRLTSRSDAARIQKLIEAQRKNPLRTEVSAVKRFSTDTPDQFIVTTYYTKYGEAKSRYMREWEQSFIESLFSTPVRFIRKACKKADALAKEVTESERIAETLKDFPKHSNAY